MELTELLNLSKIELIIITGVITYFFTSLKLKAQFNHRLVENLYEKRFATYTKLLEITQHLGKSEISFEDHKKAREEIQNWIMTSGGYLLLTKKSLKEINTMKDLLKKGKSTKEGWEQRHLTKVFECRGRLRGSLRDEFNFLHEAEISV